MAKSLTKKTKKKQLTALQKANVEIARRNKIWRKANAAQKRVLVAQDVIAQIKARRFNPQTGNWVDPEFSAPSDAQLLDDAYDNGDHSARTEFLTGKIKSCDCCALGGMFMSCTLFNNKVTVAGIYDSNLGQRIREGMIDGKPELKNKLDAVFRPEQLALIELAFEGEYGSFYDALRFEPDFAEKFNAAVSRESVAAALKFYARYVNDRNRMIAIMTNIIENKGEFVLIKPAKAKKKKKVAAKRR